MVDPTKEPEQQHESTAAEYIYKSMIPPKSPHQQNETVDALPSIGKRGRLNTGDSTRSGMMSLGSLRSMDFLTTADVALDGGSGLGLSDTSFNVDRIQSSDIVEQILLPDAAATASAASSTAAAHRARGWALRRAEHLPLCVRSPGWPWRLPRRNVLLQQWMGWRCLPAAPVSGGAHRRRRATVGLKTT